MRERCSTHFNILTRLRSPRYSSLERPLVSHRQTYFEHAHLALGGNLGEIGRQRRHFADFPEQWVADDANRIAEPDACSLPSVETVPVQLMSTLGNDDFRANDAGPNLRGA